VSPQAWRRALRCDIPALCDFLSSSEGARVGFSGRLLRDGKLRLPSPLRGAVWIAESPPVGEAEGLRGALLFHPSRLVFPVFPPEDDGDAWLALLSKPFAPASALGLRADVERYEAALGLSAIASVDYRLMSRRPAPPPAAPAYPGLVLRRAELADLEALLPLQEAYEREEVLTSVHSFNPAACRASLASTLDRQLVFLAEEGGVVVGKAGTNARGFRVDQVGGVYTLPERRGRGLARALMSALAACVEAEGRSMSLFVKPANAPARALYRGLGFEDIGDFRADYFEA
jgi:ribosomal protein S18 acetylase RimI-like enzyme